MALLFVDGFDHSGTNLTIHDTKWPTATASFGNAALVSTPTRTGTGALLLAGGVDTIKYRTIPTISGSNFTTGFAFRKTANPASIYYVHAVIEAGVVFQIGVALNPAGTLSVFKGTTATLLATGGTVLSNNTWYYIEFQGSISGLGFYSLKIDGVAEVGGGANTFGGSGIINMVGYGSSGNITSYFDDLYVLVDNGTAPTTFLGPVKIETLLPQTDAVAAGSNAGLTPSTGTDHGALVAETPPNTTDYNGSGTVGAKDTYNYPTPTIAGTIVGIQTNLYVAKSETGTRSVCAVVRTNSVDYDGANVSPATTYGYFSEVRALNPNTGVAWTGADLTALQAGMKVTV